MRIRSCFVVAFAALVAFDAVSSLAGSSEGAAAAGKPEASKPAAPVLPEADLRLSTRHGLLPLPVTVTGSLRGVDPNLVESCDLVVEWVGSEVVSGLPWHSKRTSPCPASTGEGATPGSFTLVETLEQPGIWTYRVLVRLKDGALVSSTPRDIRVVRSKLELSVTRTIPDGR